MQPIGKAIKQDDELQGIVQELAAKSAGDADAKEVSMAITLQIRSAKQGDKFWEVDPNLESSGFDLDAVSIPRSLAPSLIEGQRLLLLGKFKGGEDSSFTAYYLHSL